MSDLADRAAECCGAVEGAGAIYVQSLTGAARRPLRRAELHKCACGGKPVYHPHPALTRGGPETETLACATCGNAVGPFASRHALAEAWRLGGWRQEGGGRGRDAGEAEALLLAVLAAAFFAVGVLVGSRLPRGVAGAISYPDPVCERCGQVLDGSHRACVEER